MARVKRGRPQRRDDFQRSWIRTGIRWLVTAKIFGIVVLFDSRALQSFELPKTAFSHALAWPLAVLLGLAVWTYGLRIIPRSWLHAAVAALAIVWLASTVLAADQYLAIFGDPSRYEGVSYLIDMLILYLAISVAFRGVADFAIPAGALGGATALALGYALIQRLGLDPIAWGTDPTERPFSVFGNPDIFGHFLSVAFGVTTGFALFASGSRVALLRTVAAVAAAGVLLAAVVVATRGTLLGVAAAVLLSPFLVLRVRGASRRVVLRIAGGAVVVGVVGAVVLLMTPLGTRTRSTIAEGADLQGRIVIYEAAIAAVRDRPILGWGPDSFAAAFPHYRSADYAGAPGNQPDSSAHNWLLESAVTTGLIGALAALSLGALCTAQLLTAGLRRMPIVAAPVLLGLAAYWTHGLVSVQSVSVDWFPWAAVGIAAGIAVEPTVVVPRRQLDLVAAAAALALSTLVAASGWTTLNASHLALDAKRETAARRDGPAIRAGLEATKADSGRSQYWEQLGHAYGLKQQWREAGDAFAEAVRRAPYIASTYANLARSRGRQAFGGDPLARAAALDAARRGAALDPNNWEAESVFAEIESAFGKPERALEILVTAVSLNRNNPTNDVVASEAAARASDAQQARRLVERILQTKESAILRVTLAQLALRTGDRQSALSNAQRALELEPSNAEAQRLIASLQR